jgi:hypothetical protein
LFRATSKINLKVIFGFAGLESRAHLCFISIFKSICGSLKALFSHCEWWIIGRFFGLGLINIDI